MTGDGCLMEGVALEAISLAGNLGLDNLVLIYDNNQVTCDGPLEWINVEDVNAKMGACGWHVIDVTDGSYDVQALVSALRQAEAVTGKPVFINVRTVIGLGTSCAGTAKAHHGVFDAESVALSKRLAGQDPSVTHQIPPAALDYFRERKQRGRELQSAWQALLDRYRAAHPDLAREFERRRAGDNGDEWRKALAAMDSAGFRDKATRDANGAVLETLWKTHPALFGGGADLVNSNKIPYHDSDIFHPAVGFAGRYLRYGIREHAMAAISNGLAAYSPGTLLPFTATFFMFFLYVRRERPCRTAWPRLLILVVSPQAAPGVRMGALSHLPVIHCATHDSFAEGQNGPTHQPVELDSLYRTMPNLTYMRPCDAEEVIGAWLLALSKTTGPSLLSLGRDPVGRVPNTDRLKVARGAYVIREADGAALTLASCGTSLHYAVAAAESLSATGVATRVVSAPSFEHFDAQDRIYRDSVFPPDGTPIVSVEEYVAAVWARYVTASIGMTGYGYSASNTSNYARFRLDAKGIEARVREYLKELNGRDARRAGWRAI